MLTLLTISVFFVSCGGEDAPASTVLPVASTETAPVSTAAPVVTTKPELPPLPPASSVAWVECTGGFQCAKYDVPLDYGNAGGATIALSLRRLAATDQAQRIGALFVNPGGPGGSTIDILAGWARSMPAQIRARFDIVLMDPRGVGESSPLICHDNIQEIIGLDPYPDTAEDWSTIEDAVKEQAMQCNNVGGDILPFLGTESVARDMDRIREAMGDEQLTYFGYSYGTTIGQVYAELFPSRVRAMVLDGAVDVSLDADQRNLEQLLGFEAAYNRYLADCRARSCLPGDPATTISDLITRAGISPIPSRTGDRPLGSGEALYAIIGSLYSKPSWQLLTMGIRSALDGDGSAMLFLVDSFLGREGAGYDNRNELNSAVNCLDYVNERDPMYYRSLADEFALQAPFFGEAFAQFGIVCAFWGTDPKPLHTPSATGVPPIIVIGNTGDPATPYKWAVALASQLESGVLVTYDAEGHTGYRAGSSCIDDVVQAYLLNLTVPEEGKRCGNANITPAPPVSQ